MVGTFHATSPMSSEPPPVRWFSGWGPLTRPGVVDKPLSATPSSRWIPLASVWSLSSQTGIPTVLMFSPMASAMGREKCPLQPEPTIMTVSSFVPVISVAPSAIFFASSYIFIVDSKSRLRK